jgi:hypothetical protein
LLRIVEICDGFCGKKSGSGASWDIWDRFAEKKWEALTKVVLRGFERF